MWGNAAKISVPCVLLIGVLLLWGVSIEVIGLGIGVVGFLISAIAILYATVQGKTQLEQLDEVSKGLEEGIDQLKGEVQTHYIDVFPKFMPRIIEILTEARVSITIFCDLPAYGVVSSPDDYRKYIELIEKKARDGIPTQILHLNEDARMMSLEKQFEDDWAKLREQPSVSTFVEAAGKCLGKGDQKACFLGLVQEQQTETLTDLEEAGVLTVETGLLMPLYFWIADGDHAVFALTEFSSQAHEVGFSTASGKLTEAMEGIFGRYRGTPPAS